jgi:hypothetical protein
VKDLKPGSGIYCFTDEQRVETFMTPSREVLVFLNDLCHPDQYGHAVTREVRRRARELANKLEEELRQP